MKHIWKINGSEISYADMMKLYNKYEDSLTPITTKGDAQLARAEVGAVEGDGKTILPDTDPRKAKWNMYFGTFMTQTGITYEEQA
jgi:hypothetical protein